jgi:glycosyltransferase involved in cell wall biosynthesis
VNVVFLEASSGSVVGGSLTGMLELLRGIDRSRISPAVVLYEHKSCVAALEADGIPVSIFHKSKLPKDHALQERAGYARAKKVGAIGSLLANARTTSTLLLETYPAAWGLSKLLRGYRPDLVYVCNGFRGNADAILAAWILGVPCVVHAKGFDKFSWVERRLSHMVAGCVSMTRAIEDHCRAGGMRPGFFEVIYDGLDLEAFQPGRDRDEVRAELGLAPDDEVAGVVGNVQEWKGQHVLVEALDLLKQARPKLHVLLVGGIHRSGAAYAERLKETASARGVEGRVHWTGPRPDVPDLMNAMDVVVHTSVRGEPFGRVIIEGMAVGKAVVATRAGGVPEFTHDGVDSLLVPPGDAGALATALDRLLGDDGARASLERGARASAERFALARHVEQMTDVFRRAAAHKRDGSGVAGTAADGSKAGTAADDSKAGAAADEKGTAA